MIQSKRRRDFVTSLAAAGVAAMQSSSAQISPSAAGRKGRLKQGAMRTNFAQNMPFEDMCREAARLGLYGFDLTAPRTGLR
jgi:hypothetical protein